MTDGLSDGQVPYDDFRQRVRRYRRGDVIRLAADVAAQLHRAQFLGEQAPKVPNFVQEFTLAGVARVAVIAGNDYRRPDLSLDELIRLCGMYVNVADPDLDAEPGHEHLRRMLARMAGEQFGFQYSAMENIGRTLCLLGDHAIDCPDAPTADDWTDALGVPLDVFVRLGFTAYVAVVQNRGAISERVLRRPDIAPIFEPVGADEALALINRFFARTPNEQSAAGRALERAGYEKWSPNPLQEAPLVRFGDDLVAPVPRYILDRITPTGLYFIGLKEFGESFPPALGCMFEAYVGSQLSLLTHVSVSPEVTYPSAQGDRKTIDFFVVADEVVVLVEAKSYRPIAALRAGEDGGEDDVEKKIGRARDQILETAQLIATGQPELAHIPADRPVVGLIITLEPFHLIETFIFESVLGSTSIPITIASAHNLETVIADLAGRADVGVRLLDALSFGTKGPPRLTDATKDLAPSTSHNPIIDDSWRRWAGGRTLGDAADALAET